MRAVIDMEELPVTDRIEFLRERMLHAPVPLLLDPRPDERLMVRSRVADLGGIHLLCTKAQGGDVVRTPALARDDPRPSLMVSVIDHGTAMIVRGDHATRLATGDVGLYATGDPYRLRFTAGAERFTYQIPFDQLDLPLRLIERQLDSAIHPDSATAAAVASFLRSTARGAPRASAAELSTLERPVIDLIRLLLTRADPDTPVGRAAVAASLATRVEEHVKARLGDADLSARSIAACFSISERYVYMILARRGIDLGDAIRRQRLDRVVRLLEDPVHASLSIGAVAHRCGFADHSHLSRAFRARFGTSPSEWRRTALDQPSAETRDPRPR